MLNKIQMPRYVSVAGYGKPSRGEEPGVLSRFSETRQGQVSDFAFISPKRDPGECSGWEGFFPYYAGYPTRFAREVIRSVGLMPRSSVLDPWNGSGTTTFAAAQLGHSAIGLDLNPVMVVVARARMLPPSEADSLVPLAEEVIRGARSQVLIEHEPLLDWFEPQTAGCIRSVEQSIQRCLVGVASKANLGRLSSMAATFYVALFSLLRDNTIVFRSSNPTWIRVPRPNEERVRLDRREVAQGFLTRISSMAQALAQSAAEAAPHVTLAACAVGDSTALPLQPKSIDLVLGSPPYCTRIDYTAATRVELALLARIVNTDPQILGLQMMGTTRVPKVAPPVAQDWGTACAAFLDQVKNHPSKASAGYYYKTQADYFCKLFRSLYGISTVLRPDGRAVLVLQDSFYKDIHNPLADIAVEMAVTVGMRLIQRNDFQSKRTMGSVNRASKMYLKCHVRVESVLCFDKATRS